VQFYRLPNPQLSLGMVLQNAESAVESGISQQHTATGGFVRAHEQCERDRNGLLLVLADSAVGRIVNDAQLGMPMNQLLMQFIAPLHLSCWPACGVALWNGFIPSWRRPLVPAVPGEASGASSSCPPHAVTEPVTAGRDTRFDGAVSPFHNARLVAIILDAVLIWGRQPLPVPRANTLQRGVKPLLVPLCCDAAGTLRRYRTA
jgi:hypothetical protein